MAGSPHLRRKLSDAPGPEAGEDLVTWIDKTEAASGDVAELRHEMELGFARIDAKFERMEARFAQLEALIDKRSADLIKWSFVFWVGAVSAIAMLAKLLP